MSDIKPSTISFIQRTSQVAVARCIIEYIELRGITINEELVREYGIQNGLNNFHVEGFDLWLRGMSQLNHATTYHK